MSTPEAYKAVCKCGAVTAALLTEYFSERSLKQELERMEARRFGVVMPVEKLGSEPLSVERCKCATQAAKGVSDAG